MRVCLCYSVCISKRMPFTGFGKLLDTTVSDLFSAPFFITSFSDTLVIHNKPFDTVSEVTEIVCVF